MFLYLSQIFDVENKRLWKSEELYYEIEYLVQSPCFHTFEGEEEMIGLNFADQDEAEDFKEVVLERIRKRKMRMQQQKQSKNPGIKTSNKNPPSEENTKKEIKKGLNLESKNETEKTAKVAKSEFSFFKSKSSTKRGISKVDIGGPANFVHVDGVRHTRKGFEKVDANTDEKVSKFLELAGLNDGVLEDSAQREEIYNFVDQFDVLYEIEELEKHSKPKAPEQKKERQLKAEPPPQNRSQSEQFPSNVQISLPSRKTSLPTKGNFEKSRSRYKDPLPPPTSTVHRLPPPIPPKDSLMESSTQSLEKNNSSIRRMPPPVPRETETCYQLNDHDIGMRTNTIGLKKRLPPPIPAEETKMPPDKNVQIFQNSKSNSSTQLFQKAVPEPASVSARRLPPPIPKKEMIQHFSTNAQSSVALTESSDNVKKPNQFMANSSKRIPSPVFSGYEEYSEERNTQEKKSIPPSKPVNLRPTIPEKRFLKPVTNLLAKNDEPEYKNVHNRHKRNAPSQDPKKECSLPTEQTDLRIRENDERPQEEEPEYRNIHAKRKPPQIPKIESFPNLLPSRREIEVADAPPPPPQQQQQKYLPFPPRNASRSPSPISMKRTVAEIESKPSSENPRMKDDKQNGFAPTPPPPPPPPLTSVPPTPPSFANKESSVSKGPAALSNSSSKPVFGKENLLEAIRLKGGLKGAGLKKVEAAEDKSASASVPDGSLTSVLQLALNLIKNANEMSDQSDVEDEDFDSADSWD